jgi:hypothetical protein
MFEKFNDTARAAILMAKDIADSLHQDHISTRHLLLSIAGGAASVPQWKNPPGVSPKVEAVIAALGTTPEAIIDQTTPEFEPGTGGTPGHLPFTPDLKQALEFALRSSLMLGDNHIGPEHLLAGLARATDSTAGKVLARLGITNGKVHAAIEDSTPAPSPTAARICDVYLPVGPSLFKSGGNIYPDLATAQAAHPDKEIAPFAFPLHDGEFFDVGITLPQNRFKSWGSYADYPAAYAAAEEKKVNASGYEVVIRLMVPDVLELRGTDSRGRDVVLGRSVEYNRVRLMHRISEITAAAKAS